MSDHAEQSNVAAELLDDDATVVVQIIGLVDGRPTPLDGQWLVDYDPCRWGVAPDGTFLSAHIETTPDRDRARRFDDFRAAATALSAPSGQTRPDGGVDRPLTAFSLCIERASLCR